MDAPLPLPLADPIAGSIAAVPPPASNADPLSGDAAASEGFALLLELARLSLDGEGVPRETTEDPAAPAGTADGAPEATAAPLDALLFLADTSVAGANARQPSALAARAVQGEAPSATLPNAGTPTHDATVGVIGGAATTQGIAQPSSHVGTRAASPALPAASPAHGSPASVPAPGVIAEPAIPPTKPAGPEALLPASRTDDPKVSSAPAAIATAATTPAAVAAEPTPAIPPSVTGTPSTSTAPVELAIDTPVTHPRWRDETAERVVSLVTRGVERAELKVSPPELGPVDVRIDVKGGEATLAIVAAHSTTRDALESALPQLRELLAQQGLTLGEATVRDGRPDGERSAGSPGEASPEASTAGGSDDSSAAPQARASLARRLVDVFA